MRRLIVWLSAVFLMALVSAALFIRLPYYTLSPGSSRATEPLISVQDAPTYEDGGAIDFLTVSLRQATAAELIAAWTDSAVEVESEEDLFGKQSESENHDINVRMMADSKDAATYQALTRLGYAVTSTGTGAVVASVQPDGPANGVLTRGDVIVAVQGAPIMLNSELVAALGSGTPGSLIELAVQNFDGSDPRSIEVRLGARPDDPARGYLGISAFTRDLTFDFPVTVTINSGAVSGPSAGLAFTLGILDVLSPGSLTGGLHIATTGTMDLNGTVGPVGGVHQKVVAARRSGAELMLVPASELDEARRYAGNLRIEPADSLDQALAVLATVGGGDSVLPPKPSTAAGF
jgi:PDZ domain-containing protein